MRIVFMGTPEFAVEALDKLVTSHHDVVAVVTATDKPGGRGRKEMVASPVAAYSRKANIPLLQPEKLRDPKFLQSLADFKADLFVVVAFRMLPEVVWAMPRLGTVNLHGSWLPNYRGAAPIQWAVLNGDIETGVTVFFLKQEIDTGDIILRERVPIESSETFGTLYDKMKAIGARVLVRALNLIESGDYLRISQEELPIPLRPAPKIFPEMAHLSSERTVVELERWVRGMHPVPCAWFLFAGKKYKVHQAAPIVESHHVTPGILIKKDRHLLLGCKNGWLELTEIQPEGKQRMTTQAFLNGAGWQEGPLGKIE